MTGNFFRWFAKKSVIQKTEPLLYDELVLRQKMVSESQVRDLHVQATEGNVESIFKLSERYLRGDGVLEDRYFAFRLVRFAAEQGLQQAFVILGKYYAFGIGTLKNVEEAARWFLQTDYSQDEDILAFMAGCYHTGNGVPKDEEKAWNYWIDAAEQGHSEGFRFCQFAADAGHPRGQYILGIFYQQGISTPADIEKALHWFHKSAEQHYAPALCRLGILYGEGEFGIEKDPETAVQWLRLAAAQNDTPARSRLADYLVHGEGTEKNIDEAVRILTELSQGSHERPHGEAACQFRLGALLLHENYACYNPQEGIKWLRKSAEQNFVMAQSMLGLQYCNGLRDVVKQNWDEARSWLQKAAEQDDHVAQFHLGEIYSNGNGVPVNNEEAFNWYKKSSNAGYVPAQQKVAHCHLNGIGTPQNDEEGYYVLASLSLWGDEEARTLLQSAAVLGNAEAEHAMWLYYREQNDFKNAYPWLEKAAEHGHRKALYMLAIRCENEGDDERKFRYLRLAAEKGDADAQLRLGLSLERIGSDMKAPENEEAFRWVKASADQGHPSANYFLGNFYRDGTWVEPDFQKAFECYFQAAESGNSDGLERLGGFYANGVTVPEDDRKAFQCYQRSAELGNAKGQYQLGLCYLNGTGCRQDTELAFRWISLAAGTGHPAVMEHLRHSGLDLEKLCEGYKNFRQIQSVVNGDHFGENFDKIFGNSKKSVIPKPPTEISEEDE